MLNHTTNESTQEIPSGYCHCGCGQKTKIAKKTDRTHGYIKGQPVRFINHHEKRQPLAKRFWAKVNKHGPDDCWEWTATSTDDGYGRIRIGDQMLLAHRISYEFHYGTIPDGLKVLHHCDNPPCTNPKHLFLGDDTANAQDKIAKGRANCQTGEKHHQARFTSAQVRHLRNLYTTGNYSHAELARVFGGNKSAMRRLVLGLSYQNA